MLKYVITLPVKAVEKLGWRDGFELSAETKYDTLIVRRPYFER